MNSKLAVWFSVLCLQICDVLAEESQVSGNITKNIEEIAMISSHITETLKTYDKRLRPNAGGNPMVITAEFKVGSIGEINEADMTYSMDIFFRHWWNDPRLKSNFSQPITLSMDASSIFWIPDTYFLNSKKSQFHQVIGDCKRLILWPNGNLYYSVRVDLTLRCDMDLRLYPFDTQYCPFIVESHAYTKDDVTYKWSNRRTHGIEITSNQTAQFLLIEAKLQNSIVEKIAGNFSTMFATFSFKRRLEFFIITIFAPAIILTFMSWCSLWISADAVPARITLCITTILSLILLTSTANSTMPKISYMKAMDTFLLGSLTFIFMTLVEFVVVLNTGPAVPDQTPKEPEHQRKPQTNNELKSEDQSHNSTAANDQVYDVQPLETNSPCYTRDNNALRGSRGDDVSPPKPRHGDNSVHYIDKASRVLFPLMYLLFIGGYVAWYFAK